MALRQHDDNLVAVRALRPPTSTRLPVPCLRRPEDKNDWCWVACTRMVLEGWKKKQGLAQLVPEQCSLASKHFPPGTDCCQGGCEIGMPLDKFEPYLQNFRPSAKRMNAPIDKEALRLEVSKGPVIVAWTNPNHYIVVVDMIGDKVDICDPEPDGGATGPISFRQLEKAEYFGNQRDWIDTFVYLWS